LSFSPDLKAAAKLAQPLMAAAARVQVWLESQGYRGGHAAVLDVLLFLEREGVALVDCAATWNQDQFWAERKTRTAAEARSLRLGGGPRASDRKRLFLYLVSQREVTAGVSEEKGGGGEVAAPEEV
jgi:hypothetical protein